MITTMRELRDLIADKCDLSQPLRVVAHDVGKKAAKHTPVYVDEEHPAKIKVSPGMYSEKGVIEFAYYANGEVLMPEDVLDALDDLLFEHPKARIGWVYFFYFPLDYRFFFGKTRHVEDSLLDTKEVKNIYFADGGSNILVFEAEYGIGEFD